MLAVGKQLPFKLIDVAYLCDSDYCILPQM